MGFSGEGRLKSGWSYLIFAAIVLAAPLLFGATDRSVQALLLIVFALGLALERPVLPASQGRTGWVLLALAGLVLFKEFAPAVLFGKAHWRELMGTSFGVELPWTHSPSPVRAFETLLAVAIGGLWFLWVRTLATPSGGARRVAWAMLVAGVAVAVVVMVVGPVSDDLIYGIREAPGYRGYGPFPNRNHTAAFLAMSALVGCGCLGLEFRRRNIGRSALAAALVALSVVGLLQTQSRGGLLAFMAGVAVLGALMIWNTPKRKTALVVGAFVLIAGALFLAYGAGVAGRFTLGADGDLPTNARWTVWADTLRMWRDAPIFGHGLSSFPQLYPLYQELTFENRVVLHAESSWLQWLSELGLLVLVGAVAACGAAIFIRFRRVREMGSGFHLRAGGLAAFAVLLAHSVWDVPAHRWATAGLGLAAIALALPSRGSRPAGGRWALLPFLPFGVALLWALPLFTGRPLWSSAALARALSRNYTASEEGIGTLEQLTRYFPLDPDLQHALGVRRLLEEREVDKAALRFRIADRLRPNSWVMPLSQGLALRPHAPNLALYFFAVAVERAGHRSEEIYRWAWQETARLPGARAFWIRHAESHPSLLLSAASLAGPADAPELFDGWWARRATAPDLDTYELTELYSQLSVRGSPAKLDEWIALHPERKKDDYVTWARLFDLWGRHDRAWQVLSGQLADPTYSPDAPVRPVLDLETAWEREPGNFLHARALAAELDREGLEERRDRVILAAAARDDAPEWFVRKAAYILAGRGDHAKAVQLLLRPKPPREPEVVGGEPSR